MFAELWSKIEDAERKLRRSFGKDVSTPAARRWSTLHYHVFDHAFLRMFWTNFFEIAPGVYRSNQPTHSRFVKYKEMGIKTIVNLRGEDKYAHYLFEKETCEELGLKLMNAKLWARNAAGRHRIVHVIDTLRDAEKPFVFHCKSGADRAGFVAAMYLMIFENQPVSVARKMLSLKYIHLDFTATGVQDYILDVYEARNARHPISFEDWIRSEYDATTIQAGWDGKMPADTLKLPRAAVS
jgi:protein tyrosine/serine phosphatase